ncbi:MAG: hypothetical protein WBM83_14720 [Flavobacteriaceae bacterium]
MTKQQQIVFVFTLVIVSLKFFDAHFLNETLVNYSLFLMILFTVFISVPYVIPENKGFVFPVQLFLASVLVSVLMSYQYWDQPLKDGLLATAPYLILILFFYLLHNKFSVEYLEKIIIIYGVLYLLLYFFQLANSPAVLFGRSLWGEEFTQNRGIVRIIFPGGGVFILSTFLAINKLTSEKKHRWLWATLTLFGIIIPILQVTRQFIAGILLIYLFHAMRTLSAPKKLTVLVTMILGVVVLLSANLPVIEGLIEASKSDASEGGDYIRILAGEYFLFDFSPNTLTHIFGNGAPYTGVSNYGIYIDLLEIEQNFYLSDVGIIAVYAMFGFPGIIAFLIIWYKSFTLPLPDEFQYVKYYLWFLLLTSLTWYSTYHNHYLITTVFALYIYQVAYEKYRNQEFEDLTEIDT